MADHYSCANGRDPIMPCS